MGVPGHFSIKFSTFEAPYKHFWHFLHFIPLKLHINFDPSLLIPHGKVPTDFYYTLATYFYYTLAIGISYGLG